MTADNGPQKNEKQRLATALIRIQDGQMTVLGSSGGFPLPFETILEPGSTCPAGTGAYEIINGRRTEFKGEVPIDRWIKPEYLDGGSYVLREHSLLLTGQVLILLEIEEEAG